VIPVDQLVLHDPNDDRQLGDCLRACIASVLELAPHDVPHFVQLGADAGDTEEDGLHWFDEMRSFLATRRLDVLWVPVDQVDEYLPWSVRDEVILNGPSPRGPFTHSVVGRPDGTVLHDPHPSRDGLAGAVTSVAIISPLYETEEVSA
jgi:hypothetical protein